MSNKDKTAAEEAGARVFSTEDLFRGYILGFSKAKGKLWPGQFKAYSQIAADLRNGNYGGLIERPTGSGKTVIMGACLKALDPVLKKKGVGSLILVPETFLTGQTKRSLMEHWGFRNEDIGIYNPNRIDRERSHLAGSEYFSEGDWHESNDSELGVDVDIERNTEDFLKGGQKGKAQSTSEASKQRAEEKRRLFELTAEKRHLILTYSTFASLLRTGWLTPEKRPVIIADEIDVVRGPAMLNGLKETFKDAYRLGFTATNQFVRNGKRYSTNAIMFQRPDLIHQTSMETAITDDEICPVEGKDIPLDIDLPEKVRKDGNKEFTTGEKSAFDSLPARDAQAFNRLSEYFEDKRKQLPDMQQIWFTGTEKHAVKIAELLNLRYGSEHPAVAITRKTTLVELNEYIDKFKAGDIRALVNADVLMRGLDIPNAELCVILDPTRDPTRLIQCVGRVTRKYTDEMTGFAKRKSHAITFRDKDMQNTATYQNVLGDGSFYRQFPQATIKELIDTVTREEDEKNKLSEQGKSFLSISPQHTTLVDYLKQYCSAREIDRAELAAEARIPARLLTGVMSGRISGEDVGELTSGRYFNQLLDVARSDNAGNRQADDQLIAIAVREGRTNRVNRAPPDWHRYRLNVANGRRGTPPRWVEMVYASAIPPIRYQHEYVRAVRGSLCLSQTEMAERLGVPPASYEAFESGEKDLNLKSAQMADKLYELGSENKPNLCSKSLYKNLYFSEASQKADIARQQEQKQTAREQAAAARRLATVRRGRDWLQNEASPNARLATFLQHYCYARGVTRDELAKETRIPLKLLQDVINVNSSPDDVLELTSGNHFEHLHHSIQTHDAGFPQAADLFTAICIRESLRKRTDKAPPPWHRWRLAQVNGHSSVPEPGWVKMVDPSMMKPIQMQHEYVLSVRCAVDATDNIMAEIFDVTPEKYRDYETKGNLLKGKDRLLLNLLKGWANAYYPPLCVEEVYLGLPANQQAFAANEKIRQDAASQQLKDWMRCEHGKEPEGITYSKTPEGFVKALADLFAEGSIASLARVGEHGLSESDLRSLASRASLHPDKIRSLGQWMARPYILGSNEPAVKLQQWMIAERLAQINPDIGADGYIENTDTRSFTYLPAMYWHQCLEAANHEHTNSLRFAPPPFYPLIRPKSANEYYRLGRLALEETQQEFGEHFKLGQNEIDGFENNWSMLTLGKGGVLKTIAEYIANRTPYFDPAVLKALPFYTQQTPYVPPKRKPASPKAASIMSIYLDRFSDYQFDFTREVPQVFSAATAEEQHQALDILSRDYTERYFLPVRDFIPLYCIARGIPLMQLQQESGFDHLTLTNMIHENTPRRQATHDRLGDWLSESISSDMNFSSEIREKLLHTVQMTFAHDRDNMVQPGIYQPRHRERIKTRATGETALAAREWLESPEGQDTATFSDYINQSFTALGYTPVSIPTDETELRAMGNTLYKITRPNGPLPTPDTTESFLSILKKNLQLGQAAVDKGIYICIRESLEDEKNHGKKLGSIRTLPMTFWSARAQLTQNPQMAQEPDAASYVKAGLVQPARSKGEYIQSVRKAYNIPETEFAATILESATAKPIIGFESGTNEPNKLQKTAALLLERIPAWEQAMNERKRPEDRATLFDPILFQDDQRLPWILSEIDTTGTKSWREKFSRNKRKEQSPDLD